jgi:hypothetical protein
VTQPDAAALHKQRLEQQHQDSPKPQHSQQQDLCVPGRIESTTAPAPPALKTLPEVHDLPPVRRDAAPTAADAEFDYNKELQRGAALGAPGKATHWVLHGLHSMRKVRVSCLAVFRPSLAPDSDQHRDYGSLVTMLHCNSAAPHRCSQQPTTFVVL